VAIRNADVFPQITLRIGAPSDVQEVDALNEQLRVAAAFCAHGIDQVFQTRNELVGADPHQRAGGNVANAGRLHHDGAGPAAGEASVPVEHFGGDLAVTGCAPRDHRRNPCALFKRDRTDVDRAEELRCGGFRAGRPFAGFGFPFDAFGGAPHIPILR
jgi:hypothetical protein